MKKTTIIIAVLVLVIIALLVVLGVTGGQDTNNVTDSERSVTGNTQNEDIFVEPEAPIAEVESESAFEDQSEEVGEFPVVTVDEEEEITDFDRRSVIGLSVEEASSTASANNVPFRVGSIDGEPQAVTFDFVKGRITASVENDVVTNISVE